ncbi:MULTISPECIES: hypothetical protein [unclassified Streptomyces]|uniref:hypothetical protein n=1 Tax=unclassified Streptomyces TaxID=2593676 RepID=UPI0006FCA964|nr:MULTISPECIES: hypothetical protein [unclassified Streptomyces]KQX58877.1 hypothetical protein ASD33_00765 [Streptomyces sp. Root1304]KRB00138.1 hypothetical protein ASE09_00765 [Streptomyces sp. Root66D1]
MISEPELDGGTGFDAAEVLTEERAPRPPRPPGTRRPWLWALGGAVLASAVWGGGLYAYGQRAEPGPDMRGYRQVENLCGTAKLKALTGILGERSEDGVGPEMDDPALHQSFCSMTFGSPENGYSLTLTYAIHKEVDPGPEFAAKAKYASLNKPIDGIGEQAFFDDRSGEGGELSVLDGQIEIGLSLYRQYNSGPDGTMVEPKAPVDLSGIEVPMSQDVLSLMEALRK